MCMQSAQSASIRGACTRRCVAHAQTFARAAYGDDDVTGEEEDEWDKDGKGRGRSGAESARVESPSRREQVMGACERQVHALLVCQAVIVASLQLLTSFSCSRPEWSFQRRTWRSTSPLLPLPTLPLLTSSAGIAPGTTGSRADREGARATEVPARCSSSRPRLLLVLAPCPWLRE